MSAFLGKIHYWLFNKIQLHEELLEQVLKLAGGKGLPAEQLRIASYEKYGSPVKGALEDEINHGNIHGWLQEKIQSVEQRLAYVVTELVKEEKVTMEEISEIFRESGKAAAETVEIAEFSMEELHAWIFDFMLEGMPCDRVDRVVESDEDVFAWETTRCLHKAYWDAVQGEAANYYELRTAWINGFLSKLGDNITYSRTEDGFNTIRRS